MLSMLSGKLFHFRSKWLDVKSLIVLFFKCRFRLKVVGTFLFRWSMYNPPQDSLCNCSRSRGPRILKKRFPAGGQMRLLSSSASGRGRGRRGGSGKGGRGKEEAQSKPERHGKSESGPSWLCHVGLNFGDWSQPNIIYYWANFLLAT